MKTISTTTERTSISNGFHGWNGETNTTENGEGWKITTSKGASGKINSTARKGDFINGSFSFMMFGGKSLNLLSTKGTATEKAIREQHAQALILFDEETKDEEQPYKIEVGQIICFIGYNSNEKPEIVIYNILNSGFGNSYETINTRTKELGRADNLRDLADKFGIGHYYIKDQKFNDLNELNDFVIEAKTKEREQNEKLLQASNKIKEENSKKVEEGKKIVSIPSGTVSVIVAELMQDESDSQSDYFHSSTTKTIYLAFSNHKRDLFNEMRKACLNCDIKEIREFANVPTVNNNGQEKDEENTNYWNPKDEHREKYSGGSGFYLGAGYCRSGWRIRKEKYIDLEKCEDLYISTQEDRFFCNVEATPEPKETPNFEALEVKTGEVQIIDYSEKAIAVIGDTKPIKDQLKAIGGKFNFRLSCGAGWIFSKKQLPEVEKLLTGSI